MSNASPDKRRGNPRRGTLGGGMLLNGEIELDATPTNNSKSRVVVDLDGLLPSQQTRVSGQPTYNAATR